MRQNSFGTLYKIRDFLKITFLFAESNFIFDAFVPLGILCIFLQMNRDPEVFG
jgi:hypothetical protein